MGRKSRTIYKPSVDEDGVYLHVYNHCVEAGAKVYPLGDKEKEKFLKYLKWTLSLYSIECISAVVMSNHFHLILYVPKNKLTAEEMYRRIKLYRKNKPIFSIEDYYCVRRQELSNDLSSFMKELQQGFTCWFNKTRDFRRRGTLWEQRFKCAKLADSQALTTCLQYVELNPVRAELVEDTSDYKYSSYGIWQQTGRHPFQKSFVKHMIPALRSYLSTPNLNGLAEYYSSRFEEACSYKSKSDKKHPLLKRSRFWIDSMALGGKDVLREQAISVWGTKRGRQKRFGKVYANGDYEIMSLRQLIVDT